MLDGGADDVMGKGVLDVTFRRRSFVVLRRFNGALKGTSLRSSYHPLETQPLLWCLRMQYLESKAR